MMSGIKKAGLLFLMCISILELNSQAPGYMGKKFSAGYGIYANPAFSSMIFKYSDKKINTLHEGFIECALGKKFSLGFAGQFFRYEYNNTATVDLPSGNTSVYRINYSQDNPTGTYLIKGRNYKLYGKFFRDRYLAPWGKYFILGIALSQNLTVYNPNEMGIPGQTMIQSYATNSAVYQDFFYNDFGSTRQKFNSADIFFGNGNSRIIANVITLDYGYTIGCLAMTQMFIDELDGRDYTPDNYIEKTSRTRAAAVNRFNFYLKIGYLF